MDTTQMNEQVQTHYGELVNESAAPGKNLKIDHFEPSPGHILVEELAPDKASDGGIIIPEQAQQPKRVGWVVRVNSGETMYQVGDLVLFDLGAGTDLELEGKKLKVLLRNQETNEVLGVWSRKIFVDNSSPVVQE
jgi:co-chaperonin GroES (HSP10)